MNKIAELDLCVVSTKRIIMFLSAGNQAPDSRYDYLEQLTRGRSLRPTPEPKRSRNLPSRKTRNHSSKHGTVAVEVALCTPFLLFLIFTSFEFSRMMMIKQSMFRIRTTVKQTLRFLYLKTGKQRFCLVVTS